MKQSIQENDVNAQAALWQAKLSSDLLTAEQQQEFEDWLGQSKAHSQAWQEVHAFWQQLDTLSEADIRFLEDFPASSEEEGLVEKNAFQPIHAQIKKSAFIKQFQPIFKPMLGMAASLLLMFSLLYSLMPAYFADYRTAPGSLRTLALMDGSQIIMNSDTSLSINYTDNLRQITLYQGEAYFNVAADSARPFDVKTQAASVRALGTEFDIKSRNEQVAVTVFEHAVRVSLNNGNAEETLATGQQIIFTESSFSKPHDVSLSAVKSWLKQRLVFQDKPLSEVVAELNHYRAGTIIILDSKLKALFVTGVFDTDDTNMALSTIEQSLPVTIYKVTDKLVFISAK
ncbi:hypothetical protein AU255_08645 [Methyloprofundus sedimenti]|uniref:FecR protein domain-containing protein n=1 Tax=Methyloprofundus sedimenti TaxID=1420851 RepID=A0A1V8M9E2_9GAMM|nr:FecR family protein [Methyloprofundus sedimenti]OQK17913.1 hypothetical protein AU255_08645 [Methyloprofundus sedimenti]